jgi:endonuclease/exonuclease/phosphatase (EEP) superfamily protein YafD
VLIILEIILQLITAAILVLSTASYLGRLNKYFELTSHFRAQYLFASATCLLICLLFADTWFTAGAMICMVINLSAIAPFYLPKKASLSHEIKCFRLKLVFANVERCNTEYQAFIAFVNRHEPDIVVVQEVDIFWANSLQALSTRFPFSEVLPRGGGSGIALYSRFSFERLPISIPEGDTRPGLMIRLDIEGSPLSLLTIHTRAPLRQGYFERRNKTLATSAVLFNQLSSPKVFVGDLNTTPWSHYFRAFEKETRLQNVRKGFGLLASWPTFMPFSWLMIPIDHCLVSQDIRVIKAQTGERIGSDHLPLIVEMEIPTHSTAFAALIRP